MRKWIGALCLVFSGTLLGLRVRIGQRETIERLREWQRFLERMRTEMTCLHTPLPVLLELLRRQEQMFLSPPPEAGERSFDEAWCAVIASAAVDEECRSALSQMGIALSRGEDCGRAVDMAGEVLSRALERQVKEQERRGGVPTAVGLCWGLILAVLLL